jgi:hypothetical protein
MESEASAQGLDIRVDGRKKGSLLLAATHVLSSLCYPSPNDQHHRDQFAESLIALHAKGLQTDGRSPRGTEFPAWATSLRNEQLYARTNTKPSVRLRRRMLAVTYLRAAYEEAIAKGLPLSAVASPAKRIKLAAQTSGSKVDFSRSHSHAVETIWSESKPVLHWAMAFFDVWEELAITTVCLTPDWDARTFVSAGDLWVEQVIALAHGYAKIIERDLGISRSSMHQIVIE